MTSDHAQTGEAIVDQETVQDLRDIKALTAQMLQTIESMRARLDAMDTRLETIQAASGETTDRSTQ
jgi:hypothetical protein